MAYGIWLSWDNKADELQLPVNPSSIEVGEGSNTATYDIEKVGEISVIKSPKLTSYSFDGLFPARNYPFSAAPVLAPMTRRGLKFNPYVYYLEKWRRSKRPIRFVLVTDRYEINTACSIESFTWQESGGSGGDIEYTLTLKRYFFYAATPVEVNQAGDNGETTVTKKEPERANEKVQPKTYTVVKGDTLWIIAKKQLGNGDRWKEIQKLNNISDADLKKLQVGKVLKLP
ncbi:LysM domain-containing protein [Paenibacillus algorifonticola]|uniref:LysM domain-containing protein n=1 Tax=Paenibacillus algorifonticola TaxID=684063 RepID=A0A1I2GZ03_9BACL|nr:LysM peptidoglycan-binding domain-containing protein [Paenibacillus algorifonticola]SFF23184.1 LysM domain-containing protein [Paenibacillus algorifonticola]